MDHCSKLFLMILVSYVVAVLLVGCAATDTPIPTTDEIPTLDLPDTVSPEEMLDNQTQLPNELS